MLRVSLRSLRYGWTGFVATFLTMFFAGVFMISAGSMFETGSRSTMPAYRLAEAPLVVSGDTAYEQHGSPVASLAERVRLDEGLTERVAGVPGVGSAVPDRSFPLSVAGDPTPADPDGESRETWGHGWESSALTPYRLVDGTPPVAAGQVVVDQSLVERTGAAVGRPIMLSAGGTEVTYVVSGVASAQSPVLDDAVFFSPTDLRTLSLEPGTVDAIGVFPESGADVGQVRDRVDAVVADAGGVVLTGDDRGRAEDANVDTTDVLVIAVVLAMLSVIVGLLGVASTLSLCFQQRHREMALLRATGATPGQVQRMILAETVVLSLVAVLVATLPGLLGGRWLFAGLAASGIAPPGLVFYEGWAPTAVAATVTVLAAGGAAIIAGRRATSTKPVEALGDGVHAPARLGRLRRILAVVSFALSLVCVFAALTLVTGPFIASPSTFAAIFFAVGLALIQPVLTRWITAAVGPVLRLFGGTSGRLAGLNTRARAARIVAVTTPIMLLTGIATANMYLITTEASVKNVYTENLHSNVVLRSGPDGFSPAALADVRGLPEVEAASEVVASSGYVVSPEDPWGNKGLAGWQLLGYTPGDFDGVGAAEVAAGSLDDVRGTSVAIASQYAEALGTGVGGEIGIMLGDGRTETFRIAALTRARDSFETILMPAEVLAAHTSIGRPSHIVVSPTPGVSDEQLAASLSGLAAGRPGYTVTDREGLTDAFASHLNAQALTSYVMTGTLLGYITIAVVNALWLAVRNRSREFGLQRLTGASRGQVYRMMAWEAGITAAIGVGLGTIVAPFTFIPFSLARAGSLLPVGSIWIYVAIAGFATVLTVAATLLATRQALKVSPLHAAQPA